MIHYILDIIFSLFSIYIMKKNTKKFSRTFTYEQAIEIWEKYESGIGVRPLSREYNCSRNAIKTIVNRGDPRSLSYEVIYKYEQKYCEQCSKKVSPWRRFCSPACWYRFSNPDKEYSDSAGVTLLSSRKRVYSHDVRKNNSSRFSKFTKSQPVFKSETLWAIRRQRMIHHNPMKNPEVVLKMSETLKEGYASGRIQKTFGKDHPNWRGNRDFSKACRDKLYKFWIYPILQRDSFCCTMCGKYGQMHVHHIRPLRDIINVVLKEHDIKISYLNNNIGSNTYNEMVNNVVKNHKLEDGITLCAKCHAIVDDRYRRYNED